MEWVRVKDRLPEAPGWYQVFALMDGEPEVHTAFYYDYLEEWGYGPPHSQITHWQPLAAPPAIIEEPKEAERERGE